MRISDASFFTAVPHTWLHALSHISCLHPKYFVFCLLICCPSEKRFMRTEPVKYFVSEETLNRETFANALWYWTSENNVDFQKLHRVIINSNSIKVSFFPQTFSHFFPFTNKFWYICKKLTSKVMTSPRELQPPPPPALLPQVTPSSEWSHPSAGRTKRNGVVIVNFKILRCDNFIFES